MMPQKIGLIWDSPQLFSRLVEDCGHQCDLITPHLLAAPFFRQSLHAIIIPAGFADRRCSSVLAALRALDDRIAGYVKAGGTVLVFGAGTDRSDAYDWIPFGMEYRHHFFEENIRGDTTDPLASIIEHEEKPVSYDGTLIYEGDGCILTARDGPVLLSLPYGEGRFIVTTIHEYPSRQFLTTFCEGKGETFF